MATETDATELPPAYTRTAGTSVDRAATDLKGLPSPSYEAPTSFRIGAKTLAPLVRVGQLKAHLGLLRAFYQLRATVEEGLDPRLPKEVAEFQGEQRWAWFVSLAVERFERWVETMHTRPLDEWVQDEIPPIDVLMVWHAYLLNPGWYSEDCTRSPVMLHLSYLNDCFLYLLTVIDDFSVFEPIPERVKSWAAKTVTAFDPFDACSYLTHRAVTCPKCDCRTIAPFIAEDGKGYAQQNFSVPCASLACAFEITKERLGINKLLRDLIRIRTVPEQSIAGTAYMPLNLNDTSHAKTTKDILLRNWQLCMLAKIETTADEAAIRAVVVRVAEIVEWRKANLRTNITPTMRGHSVSMGRSIGRILSAYTDDRPFSIDLVGAVLRQGSFVKKMHDFGWTDPAFFESAEDAVVLQHCVVRYHAFLDLMAASPGSFYVPTLDIDLAWHTHQLMAKNYQLDCANYVKRHIDHDDKIEEGHLSDAFDITSRAWKDRFGVPYTYCGCPLPGETIGQRMSRLRVNIRGTSSYSGPKGGLALPADAHPDLVAGTHPSDHNAVYVRAQKAHRLTERERERHAEKLRKRRARDLQLVQEGKMSEAEYHRGQNHNQAFLVPVPFYGYWTGPPGGCIAAGGSVVGGVAGAAACAMGIAGCAASGGCGAGASHGGGEGGGVWGGGGGGGHFGGHGGSGAGGCGGGCGGG